MLFDAELNIPNYEFMTMAYLFLCYRLTTRYVYKRAFHP